ncbi:MAG TPA: hypothetical protein VJG32_12990 [Anaerolineae bacterium]|nr:hypothetical protein [Anaerolineae bacterium]
MISEPIAVTLQVVTLLDRLGVPYAIGGSLASSIYGAARMTMDADLIAEVRSEHVAALVQGLSSDFYVDADTIRDAITHKRSFSVVHLASMFKVDVFIPKLRQFDRAQLERRVKQVVATDPERTVYVATAEDTILAKLEWYRLGNEVSERQWRDVLGILQVQAERLDLDYLHRSAEALQVADLLNKALSELRTA